MDRVVQTIISNIADVILTAFANALIKKVRAREYMFADELIDCIDELMLNNEWIEDIDK